MSEQLCINCGLVLGVSFGETTQGKAEQELSSLRQEMFDSLDREGHRIEQLRRDLEAAQSAIREQAGYVAEVLQELEQSRVNEGEAMLVLEGTEAKLEEAKRLIVSQNEAAKTVSNVHAWKMADEIAENEKLRAALRALVKACLAYDQGIIGRAARAEYDLRESGGAIATGKDLDALYEAWMKEAERAERVLMGKDSGPGKP